MLSFSNILVLSSLLLLVYGLDPPKDSESKSSAKVRKYFLKVLKTNLTCLSAASVWSLHQLGDQFRGWTGANQAREIGGRRRGLGGEVGPEVRDQRGEAGRDHGAAVQGRGQGGDTVSRQLRRLGGGH